jgi:transcription initiation factor TFIIE subunit alpha
VHLSKKVVESTIEKTSGKETLPLVNALKNKKDVSEFKLATDIKKDINETRNILYKLSNQNLVSSIRKKDKSKGWYVYYWTLNTNRMKYLAKTSKATHLKKLNQRLEEEKNIDFYSCINQCQRRDFERATEINFRCPECGDMLNQRDNTKIIKELEKEIKKLKY